MLLTQTLMRKLNQVGLEKNEFQYSSKTVPLTFLSGRVKKRGVLVKTLCKFFVFRFHGNRITENYYKKRLIKSNYYSLFTFLKSKFYVFSPFLKNPVFSKLHSICQRNSLREHFVGKTLNSSQIFIVLS